eukprot:CAMPEP_0206243648 /NCGR_PEP_ID=MMETSP0047_2-20121206/17716_1 /ASSEMBLY_ACC=CAM_ASM_000192 /TAXON_ID=195065 /ORGANISM="Chroomonas mesostigmatica_cf, Strain CCMP1168" /LENGTH=185 /DNA_ID=CAMNT_0053668775 /DNA_START=26 /DNA_END=583 /DNA_ORIENTATION=-
MADKKMKAAIKEGGKKGVELLGCADLGGLEFFTTKMDAPEGDLELLQVCMDAANKEVDPNEEESKGGSGGMGKLIWSASNEKAEGPKQIAVINYVPEALKDKCNAEEWMTAVLKEVGGGEIIKSSPLTVQAIVKEDGAAGRFILKDKDTIQAQSVQWLKAKGLFPQADDNGEDDWVPDDDQGIEW